MTDRSQTHMHIYTSLSIEDDGNKGDDIFRCPEVEKENENDNSRDTTSGILSIRKA